MGRADARDRAGGPVADGRRSPIDFDELHTVIRARSDGTATEWCPAHNRRVGRTQRTTPASFRRAMRRVGYVLKNRPRPSEIARPDVRAKHAAYVRGVWRINPQRLGASFLTVR